MGLNARGCRETIEAFRPRLSIGLLDWAATSVKFAIFRFSIGQGRNRYDTTPYRQLRFKTQAIIYVNDTTDEHLSQTAMSAACAFIIWPESDRDIFLRVTT